MLCRQHRRCYIALIEVRGWRERIANGDSGDRTWRGYWKAMVRACRLGLADHAEVSGWVASRRLLGDVATLRRARRGLEADVGRPMRFGRNVPLKDDASLFLDIAECLEAGLSEWSEIQVELERRGRIPRMQRVQFNRIVEHLGLKDGKTKRTKSRLRLGETTIRFVTVPRGAQVAAPLPRPDDHSFAAQVIRAQARYRRQ